MREQEKPIERNFQQTPLHTQLTYTFYTAHRSFEMTSFKWNKDKMHLCVLTGSQTASNEQIYSGEGESVNPGLSTAMYSGLVKLLNHTEGLI